MKSHGSFNGLFVAMMGVLSSSGWCADIEYLGHLNLRKPAYLSLIESKGGSDLYVTSFETFGDDEVRVVRNIGEKLPNELPSIQSDLLADEITCPNGIKKFQKKYLVA